MRRLQSGRSGALAAGMQLLRGTATHAAQGFRARGATVNSCSPARSGREMSDWWSIGEARRSTTRAEVVWGSCGDTVARLSWGALGMLK